ncbi:MAG: poly(R)-hydroxyalkanoic acid synthase subunit PhaE [Rhodanobacter sp.]
MAEQASDFLKNYQALAQQSWDAWTRQLQQQQQPPANPFFTPPAAPASGNDTLERTLAGLKGYFDLMQGAAASSGAGASGDWRQQLQQMFGGTSQPFAQAFGGIDSSGAEGFTRQWQSWLQATQHSGFGDLPCTHGPTPAFGLNREQQMQQDAMSAAVLASLQASARYHALIQRANTQGMEKLQSKLAQHAEPGRQVDSLKALYDLWVDSVEEAYAEIALSDEFREAYGEMVNTQMRVRQMQQKQTEQMCQQLGVPTRSEVSSLGERLQQLRREVRGKQNNAQAEEITELRRELNALKRQLAASGNRPAAAPAAKSRAKPEISAVKKAIAKAPAPPSRKVAVKTVAAKKTAATNKSRPASASRANPRKRK